MKRLLFFIISLALALWLTYEVTTLFRIPPETPRTEIVLFIKPNSTVKSIAHQLVDNGIVTSAWKFRFLAKIRKADRKLKPGEYRFYAPSSPDEIIQSLLEGKVLQHKITFPEGITVVEVGNIYASQNLIPREKFTQLISDSALAFRLELPAPSFEGFLFPDTYYFSKLDSPEKMIQTMVNRFREVATPENKKRAQQLGFSLHQWVTLASIIEKESSVSEEQPIISSVFHNRLKKNMRLQSDPTVIYGIKNFNGNITKRDLLAPTEYNTYTRNGLPPGPIANPGATALRSALFPAQTDYLYFVGKRDGTHAFSKTYEEHARNVAFYQLRKSKRR